MASQLEERYDERIAGVLSCYDRVVVTGTLPSVCYAEGMTRFLFANAIRIFDYPEFALKLRDRVRQRAASLAAEAGVEIEHVAKNHVRKETVVAKVLETRGEHPGLVHVISAMEACDAYQPWHDKTTHKTFVRPDSGKCLHYYFYFIDADLGLVYLRVPTWAPFRLQFYCNGHSWLARRLTTEGIDFTMADNAFARIADWRRAQELADGFSPDRLLARPAPRRARPLRRDGLPGARCVRSNLPLEPDAGGIFPRSGLSLSGHARPALRATHPGVGAQRQSRADRYFPWPPDHSATGSGIGQSVLDPDRRDLHQASLRQRLDQNVRQVRLRVAYRNHHQRRVLLQAPPQGGTSGRPSDPRHRSRQKNHLQPDRPS